MSETRDQYARMLGQDAEKAAKAAELTWAKNMASAVFSGRVKMPQDLPARERELVNRALNVLAENQRVELGAEQYQRERAKENAKRRKVSLYIAGCLIDQEVETNITLHGPTHTRFFGLQSRRPVIATGWLLRESPVAIPGTESDSTGLCDHYTTGSFLSTEGETVGFASNLSTIRTPGGHIELDPRWKIKRNVLEDSYGYPTSKEILGDLARLAYKNAVPIEGMM